MFNKDIDNESNYKVGDMLQINGELNNSVNMVVGESDSHVHTFIVSSDDKNMLGSYIGIFKAKENLDSFHKV
jgi:hypothetical protein